MKLNIIKYAVWVISYVLLVGCQSIEEFNQQIEVENKIFRLGLSNNQPEDNKDFYSIRMDVQFQSAEEYKALFEGQNFNYIMNDICGDFKFLNGRDTISCANNFTTFNNAVQSVSIICMFPAQIRKADEWLLRENCFLTKNLIQKI